MHTLTMPTPLIADYLFPTFAADALCLGPHWIYDATEITRIYSASLNRYDAPHSKYHPGKRAGDFTHYGDQTLALLRSIVTRGGFDAEGWKEDWSRFWSQNTTSYRDGATRQTLENLAHGNAAPSPSHDLGGASRIAPILAAHHRDPLEIRIAAARAQTALTHGDPSVQDAAELFTRWVDGLSQGQDLASALEGAASASYAALDAAAVLNTARNYTAASTQEAATSLGLSCNILEALPLTLCLALHFADKPREALTTNALLGGDSAARGLLLGLVMGAAHGQVWMPPAWLDDLRAKKEIEALLNLSPSKDILLA
jgi:ADP-ribosylglycohydrolase